MTDPKPIPAYNPASAEDRHQVLMQGLSDQLLELGRLVPPGARVVYLDYPVHFNVGDLLIHWGGERLFERLGWRIEARFSIFDLCHADPREQGGERLKRWALEFLTALPRDVVLVFHGGGNFGDLYRHHQALREAVVAACPSHRIVLLPQSIHFLDATREEEALAAMARHDDLHFFVRDQPSLALVQRHMRRVALMPDTAHALWGLLPAPPIDSARTLEIRRVDGESVRRAHSGSTDTMDWEDLVSWHNALGLRVVRKSMSLDLEPSRRLLYASWLRLRDAVVGRAVAAFGDHSEIATDRLHAIILACLTCRPVRFGDNSYGKLSRYVDSWLAASPLISREDARHGLVEGEAPGGVTVESIPGSNRREPVVIP